MDYAHFIHTAINEGFAVQVNYAYPLQLCKFEQYSNYSVDDIEALVIEEYAHHEQLLSIHVQLPDEEISELRYLMNGNPPILYVPWPNNEMKIGRALFSYFNTRDRVSAKNIDYYNSYKFGNKGTIYPGWYLESKIEMGTFSEQFVVVKEPWNFVQIKQGREQDSLKGLQYLTIAEFTKKLRDMRKQFDKLQRLIKQVKIKNIGIEAT